VKRELGSGAGDGDGDAKPAVAEAERCCVGVAGIGVPQVDPAGDMKGAVESCTWGNDG
jgi:hypothetical protein